MDQLPTTVPLLRFDFQKPAPRHAAPHSMPRFLGRLREAIAGWLDHQL